ncbi:MAG: hypothetical protein AB7G44_12775 [Bacteroidia bacterium]
MKNLFLTFLTLALFTTASAQFPGHTIGNIQVYMGDMLEQDKWDFDKEYRWNFYICADDEAKLTSAQKELSQLGFSNFELIPNSVSHNENGTMLHMLSFEKTAAYIPQTLLDDINLFYNLEKNLQLSSFDDYGNYELNEEVSQPTASSKTHIF